MINRQRRQTYSSVVVTRASCCTDVEFVVLTWRPAGRVCVRPALAIPRPGDPIILVVDASSTSVGACAMQRDTGGHEKPIAYLSRKLSPTQMKWSMIEREAFAVMCFAKKVCYCVWSTYCRIFRSQSSEFCNGMCSEKFPFDSLVIVFTAVWHWVAL